MILNTDSFFSSVNSAPVDVFQDALFPGSVKNDMALLDWASFSGATDRHIRWDAILTFNPRASCSSTSTATFTARTTTAPSSATMHLPA
ncbi:hypothetical protein PF007_g21551 [Phytophthora fragariae]|uniref:Uncharacterized protein n=1 Tax=Phytophthora fragariae TaxID=53985 RepID=A0A6A3QWM8_9STRA|nr:hypothetical protein PF007_g21551 [Phytophthora fragariae]